MSLTTSQIISVDDLRAAVSRMPKTIPPWMGTEGARYQLTVSPGMVRVARRDPQAAERAFDKRFGERAREVRAMLDDEMNQTFAANGYPEGMANLKGIHPGMTGEKRGSIRGFSRQSRARMVRTLCELDYSPLFEGGSKPGMLTLTVPGEWEKLFPTVKHYKAAINRFRVAYRYSWGREIVGVWKNEYQRRGAPHLHLMMVIPKGRARGTGEDFRTWAAREWARACRTLEKLCKCDLEVITEHPRECEYSKHVAAGIRVDFDEAGNWSDAKRIAIYYAKHGLFGAKEYQNQPPELWVEAGAVGRFWGYWGLRKGGVTIEVDMRRVVKDPDPSAEIQKTIEKCLAAGIQVTPALTEHVSNRDYRYAVGESLPPLPIVIERWLRRRARKQSFMQRIQVTRHKINFDTGEVKEVRRWVKRRKQFYSGGSGFLVVNNGLAAADELRQLMEWWVAESGHKTAEFTMYDDLQKLHATVDVEQHEWAVIRRRAQLRAAAAPRERVDSDA